MTGSNALIMIGAIVGMVAVALEAKLKADDERAAKGRREEFGDPPDQPSGTSSGK